MRKSLLAMTMLLLSIADLHAQSPYKIFTSPKLPPRDALERMNLTMAWNRRVTVDGQRDGIYSVQVIPGRTNQLVVQTYKGGVFLFDADNGDLIWKTQVGVPYWTSQPAGWNSQCIFVPRRNILHVLNRFNGTQRVYQYDPGQREPTFGFRLQFAPSAAPVADEEFVYVCMANRLHAIFVPDFEEIERARRSAEKFEKLKPKDGENGLDKPPTYVAPRVGAKLDSPQPFVYWAYALANQLIDVPALFSGEQVSVLSAGGTLTSVDRYNEGARIENFEFKANGKSPGGAGQHQSMAYIASDDFNLYAVHMKGGALVWRYVAGAPILSKPEVNDQDIFIAPEKVGLRKIDRASGREVWTNRDAQKFLAANQQYVYALDHVGKFFVLDTKRGSTMASYDLSQWVISVANEYTDRIYLAANDGQVICLRHRDLAKALVMKTVEENRPKAIKKKEEKKEDEKKEEEKKEEKAAVKLGHVFAIASQQRAAPRLHAMPADQTLWARREVNARAQR